jgi:flavin reductase (DIM6/NTAB) family NADH-FMN oxidoreductase RutF
MCCSLSLSPSNYTHSHALTPLIEGCINIISEHFIEAANATSVNAPYGISEWALTGLHSAPCTTVKASRVKESIFSIEGKLVETKEFESRATPGKKTGVLAIIEGVRFWAREDAINEEGNLIDPGVSIPIPGSLSACCNMKE